MGRKAQTHSLGEDAAAFGCAALQARATIGTVDGLPSEKHCDHFAQDPSEGPAQVRQKNDANRVQEASRAQADSAEDKHLHADKVGASLVEILVRHAVTGNALKVL